MNTLVITGVVRKVSHAICFQILSINQSISQSVSQSVSQSINQSSFRLFDKNAEGFTSARI